VLDVDRAEKKITIGQTGRSMSKVILSTFRPLEVSFCVSSVMETMKADMSSASSSLLLKFCTAGRSST
jgi:hypothetical protein